MKSAKLGLPLFAFTWLICMTCALASAQSVQQISNAGTSAFQPTVFGSDGPQQTLEMDPAVDYSATGDDAAAPIPGKGLVVHRTLGHTTGNGPVASSLTMAPTSPQLLVSFDGLNHRNQRLANNGNQFSVEPPDQGLCVGNGFVVEAVNDVLNVYDTGGHSLLGVTDLNTFYGYIPAIVRSTLTFGPEVTDPSCYYDPDTQRWFIVILTLDRVGTTSTLSGTNHLDVAVSTGSSPLGTFNIYRLPAQDDGTQGTPNHNCAGGPCFGDYPHIGADANGFYITTNEFNFFAPGFRGSQIYAASKQALARGDASVSVFQFDTAAIPRDGLPGHTVWPAISPSSQYSTDANGTEYFLSSLAVFSPSSTDNRLRIWALSNTQSLNTATPALVLNDRFIRTQTYGRPPKSGQKQGDIPLGDCINDTTTTITSLGGFVGCWQALFATEPGHNEVESQHVDSNDSRMQQVVFANKRLWGALDTTVTVGNPLVVHAGVAWFILQPHAAANTVTAGVVRQGTLAADGRDLTYPAVGATSKGKGVIAFTLLGNGNGTTDPGVYPSAAFVTLDAANGAGPIHTIAAGPGPDDGFTSYVAEVGVGGRNRWGDYGATATDGGSIWVASEYIGEVCSFDTYISFPFGGCNGTRTSLANWFTRISQLSY